VVKSKLDWTIAYVLLGLGFLMLAMSMVQVYRHEVGLAVYLFVLSLSSRSVAFRIYVRDLKAR
jgi:hypothetical protein